MDSEETVFLKHYTEDQRNTHVQGGTRGNDSEEEEDDEMGGGQRVKCNQQ